MSQADPVVLPGTLHRFLELFATNLQAANEAKRERGREKNSKPPRRKSGGAAAKPSRDGDGKDGDDGDDGDGLTEAEVEEIQALLPHWLHILYAASIAVATTPNEGDSGACVDSAGTATMVAAAVDRGEARQSCQVAIPLSGLMALPAAVEETTLTHPQLATIPTPQRTHVATHTATETRSRHARLPPLHASLSSSSFTGVDGRELALPLQELASLSWLHHSWVHLVIALAANGRNDLLAIEQRSSDGDQGTEVAASVPSPLAALSHAAATLYTSLAHAATAATSATALANTNADAVAHAMLPRHAALRCIEDVCGVLEDKIEEEGEGTQPPSLLSLMANIFFLECCRVAAAGGGGDADLFRTEHVPIHIFVRTCCYLSGRTRSCLARATGRGGTEEAMTTTTTTVGRGLAGARSGVLVAVALAHPMTGTRVVERVRRHRPQPPAAPCQPQQQQQPQWVKSQGNTTSAEQGQRHGSPEGGDVVVTEAGSEMAINSVGSSSGSGGSSRDLAPSDDEDYQEESEDEDEDEAAEDWLNDLDGGDLFYDGGNDGADDSADHSSEGRAKGKRQREGAIGNQSGGGGPGAPMEASTVVQCDAPLASLLFTYYGGGDEGESVVVAERSGEVGLGREAYGRLGHLCWFPDAGSKAHQRQLLRRDE